MQHVLHARSAFRQAGKNLFVVPSFGGKVSLVRISTFERDGGRQALTDPPRFVDWFYASPREFDKARRAVGVSGKKHVVHVVLSE